MPKDIIEPHELGQMDKNTNGETNKAIEGKTDTQKTDAQTLEQIDRKIDG